MAPVGPDRKIAKLEAADVEHLESESAPVNVGNCWAWPLSISSKCGAPRAPEAGTLLSYKTSVCHPPHRPLRLRLSIDGGQESPRPNLSGQSTGVSQRGEQRRALLSQPPHDGVQLLVHLFKLTSN